MRKFSSYGSPNHKLHYYAPREALIADVLTQLKGDMPDEGGHYITVWAPRQTGKSWLMREAVLTLQQEGRFDAVILPLQHLAHMTDINSVVQALGQELTEKLGLEKLAINTLPDFNQLFARETLSKPLILVLDEFDTLPKSVMAGLARFFRNVYLSRQNQTDKPSAEKDYLLHSLALIGMRTVLDMENIKGAPFNVQRNLHVPNLTHDETAYLFDWYQQERNQKIDPEVVERIWHEFQGQPGFTCWFGELLTETYNEAVDQPITLSHFEGVYATACNLPPDNNILNIISKAKQEPYKAFVLELFQTKAKINFVYDDPVINFLYMNGVVAVEKVSMSKNYVKFPCPYIQKQLFNYFARDLYDEMDCLYDPFEDLSDTISEDSLNITLLLRRYEQYLQANRELVLKNAPRRKDLRVYEAVFHFHLYLYLASFLRSYDAQVQPEFPTTNAQINLLIRHAGQLFGLELKSFADQRSYRKALIQAVKYGRQRGVTEVWLVLFIESVDETNRLRFEADYTDDETRVTVHPRFVQTENA